MSTNPPHPDIRIKTFTITVDTPDGSLPPAEVNVPDVPMGLADIVQPIYQLCNGIVSLALKKSAESGNKATCGPGCGICCNQLVPLSIPEALFLVEYIRQMPLGERAEVLRRFRKNEAEVQRHGLLERMRAINEESDTFQIPAAYWQLALPCPFLIDDSCYIHEVRPCACREYNVTSPAADCADPFSGRVVRIRPHRKMTTALSAVAADLLGTKPVLVPLPLLLEWFESHEEYAVRQWQGIALFDLTLKHALGTAHEGPPVQ